MVAAGMAGHLGLAMMTIAQHAQAAREAKEKADLLEQAGLKASAHHVRARQELHEEIVRKNGDDYETIGARNARLGGQYPQSGGDT